MNLRPLILSGLATQSIAHPKGSTNAIENNAAVNKNPTANADSRIDGLVEHIENGWKGCVGEEKSTYTRAQARDGMIRHFLIKEIHKSYIPRNTPRSAAADIADTALKVLQPAKDEIRCRAIPALYNGAVTYYLENKGLQNSLKTHKLKAEYEKNPSIEKPNKHLLGISKNAQRVTKQLGSASLLGCVKSYPIFDLIPRPLDKRIACLLGASVGGLTASSILVFNENLEQGLKYLENTQDSRNSIITATVGGYLGAKIGNSAGIGESGGAVAGICVGVYVGSQFSQNTAFDNAKIALAIAASSVPFAISSLLNSRRQASERTMNLKILRRMLELSDPVTSNDISPYEHYTLDNWKKACQGLRNTMAKNNALPPEQKSILNNIVDSLESAYQSNTHLQISIIDKIDSRNMNENEYVLIANLLAHRFNELS